MKDIKSKLEEIVTMYTVLRQCGHTTAVVEGAKNTNAYVIVHHNSMGGYIDGLTDKSVKWRSVNSLESLRGIRAPMVFDNTTIFELAKDSLREIERLELELEKTKIKNLCQ